MDSSAIPNAKLCLQSANFIFHEIKILTKSRKFVAHKIYALYDNQWCFVIMVKGVTASTRYIYSTGQKKFTFLYCKTM